MPKWHSSMAELDLNIKNTCANFLSEQTIIRFAQVAEMAFVNK